MTQQFFVCLLVIEPAWDSKDTTSWGKASNLFISIPFVKNSSGERAQWGKKFAEERRLAGQPVLFSIGHSSLSPHPSIAPVCERAWPGHGTCSCAMPIHFPFSPSDRRRVWQFQGVETQRGSCSCFDVMKPSPSLSFSLSLSPHSFFRTFHPQVIVVVV